MPGIDPKPETNMDESQEILCALCGNVNPSGLESCRFCGNLLRFSSANGLPEEHGNQSGEQTLMVFNRRSRPRRYRLVRVGEDGTELERYDIDNGTTIGRTNGEILLHDRHVSRRHCAFTIHNGRLYLKDLNSTNGIYVRVRSSARTKLPAELLIGHTICRVVRKSS